MAKTAAEKQRAYRERKRNARQGEAVTRVTKDEHERVTECDGLDGLMCQVCGGPVQHPKVVKCLKCSTGTPAPRDPRRTAEHEQPEQPKANTPAIGLGTHLGRLNAGDIVGPLSVYSPERWAYLQGRGYVWDAEIQRGLKAHSGGTTIAVTVPGDPAYDGKVA